MTERAHALLSLPTSALTPRAIGRRNSLIQEGRDLLSRWTNKGSGSLQLPKDMEPLDIPELDAEEDEEEEIDLMEDNFVPSMPNHLEVPAMVHGAHHQLGIVSDYQYPSYSPSLESLRRKNKKKTPKPAGNISKDNKCTAFYW